jgi:predicted O-methyltransferase YrrM
MDEVPSVVARAQQAARQAGFPLTREEAAPGRASASLPGVGRFLAMLAAGCTGGQIGEMGTGAGIGTAWISSAMPGDCTLITAEIDESLAGVVRDLLAGTEVAGRVHVIAGDALSTMTSRGPFDLLFADSGVRDPAAFAALVGLLRVGGRIVMDDVTPVLALPPDSPLRASDPKRQLFAGEPRLAWTEVVLPDLANSLLVGTRAA